MEQLIDGLWTYRSLLNNPDLSADFDSLEFGRGNISFQPAPAGEIKGLIYGPGWELELKGSVTYGNPATLWFRGTGVVGGSEWIYEYIGYMIPHIPSGKNQVPAFTGTVFRVIPHPDGQGGTAPAGVVCSFYAVRQPSR